MGKSSLIDYVEGLSGVVKINEPDHLEHSINDNISEWYKGEHMRRMDLAMQSISNGRKVIMERSLLSNISYQYAVYGRISNEYRDWLKRFSERFGNVSIVFLYGCDDFIIKQSREIKDAETACLITEKNFRRRYIDFYREILPKYVNGVHLIKIDQHDEFKNKKDILFDFYKTLPFLEKEFVTCSSMVAQYKNKILLLYDKNYKHYVLPQGHQEAGENLHQTAIREMMEETGFNDIQVLKKIKKYQYHYPTRNKIIYKNIHVYLVRILSGSKSKKKFGDHENYSNRFFSPEESVLMARWRQDKDAIRNAIDYLKKASTH